ncbi:MAG TPA: zincin-like metallopeptidase domain-containing protein, partial [Anseongella sp.]
AITLPLREQFDAADLYYATLLHELGHWTGHPTRLDRDLVHTFGSEGYAREELRAEIASLLIGEELHIGHDPTRHAAYVAHWIKILEDHPFEIHAAAADAEKIFKYLTALERKQEIKAEQHGDRVQPFALETGDVISYKEHRYEVLRSDKSIIIQDQLSGAQVRLQKEDGLYRSLVQHKAQSMGRGVSQQLPQDKTMSDEPHAVESLGSRYHR